MFKNLNITQIAIIALLVYILFQQECSDRREVHHHKTVHTQELVYDSSERVIETPVPVPYVVERNYYHDSIVNNLVEVDTNAVIRYYFTKYYYSDSIEDDSIKVYLDEVVFKNNIVDRDFKYKIKFPTTINKTYNIYDHNSLYAGLKTSFGNTTFGLTPTLGFERKWGMFDMGYDLLNKQIHLGVYKKFDLRKPKLP